MYNRHFGFLESPFSITPDPRFYYANSVYLEAYANLRYGIEAKKGFIAITGEVGTGKTTLLRKLIRNFESTTHYVFIFNTDLTFNELLRFILSELGLPTEGKDRLTLIEELNAYSIEQLEKGHIVCLLIDEGQKLSDESLEGLRLLSNLETDREKLLQIVLMGQPELNARLDQPNLRQLKQRVAIQCELSPLHDQEVDSYINFRLQAAGYKGKALFHPEAVQKIASYSKGIPRLINVICDNALLIAYAASQKTVSAYVITEVARDLRLRLEAQPGGANNTVNASAPIAERETAVLTALHRASRQARRLLKATGGMFLFILVVVILASVIDPQTFSATAMRILAGVKRNLNQWALLANQKPAPQIANTKPAPQIADTKAEHVELKTVELKNDADLEDKAHRIILPYGSTIYQVATEEYGANAVLGMDLIKEFNPEITNLNWVPAGQQLVLPSLTRETLLRQQLDGSYRVIVGSFLSLKGADEFSRRIVKLGHRAVITSIRVSNDLVLHRLEIDDLKTFEEAFRILETGLKSQWLTLADQSGTSELGSQGNTY
jgi:type II secretory pathway predicted ATPase ExeA